MYGAGGGSIIYGRHMIIHNGQFAKCEVLENFQGLCDPRTRTKTRTCELILEDPRGQGLSSRTTTLHLLYTKPNHRWTGGPMDRWPRQPIRLWR